MITTSPLEISLQAENEVKSAISATHSAYEELDHVDMSLWILDYSDPEAKEINPEIAKAVVYLTAAKQRIKKALEYSDKAANHIKDIRLLLGN